MSVLEGLEPRAVFKRFEEICGIPHGSYNMEKISNYLVDFAKERGLKYVQDDAKNVVIYKPATKGAENAKPVIIQGHMDMVCEKDADFDFDFETEGLKLKLEDGVISAEGTTLGGDDGIAVAYMLALLEAENVAHPALECLFTVDEEVGMLGAEALDCSVLEGRTMLNLDSEEEGYLLVSCAGGAEAICHLPVKRAWMRGCCLDVKISGLTGGHSGAEIDKWRANANELMGRFLYEAVDVAAYGLVSVNGGLKDNAIPRECTAKLVVHEDEMDDIIKLAEEMEETFKHEFATTDPELAITVTKGECDKYQVMRFESAKAVVIALINMPAGIQKMSMDVPGLVQTSLNMGILKTLNAEVVMNFCVRSSMESEKKALISRIEALTELLDGVMEIVGDYPAWEYNRDSALKDIMVDVFREKYGREPVIMAIHAGLECGLFAGKMPGLDCVSIGPDMKDIHTAKEQLDAGSVKRTWEYVVAVLEKLAAC